MDSRNCVAILNGRQRNAPLPCGPAAPGRRKSVTICLIMNASKLCFSPTLAWSWVNAAAKGVESGYPEHEAIEILDSTAQTGGCSACFRCFCHRPRSRRASRCLTPDCMSIWMSPMAPLMPRPLRNAYAIKSCSLRPGWNPSPPQTSYFGPTAALAFVIASTIAAVVHAVAERCHRRTESSQIVQRPACKAVGPLTTPAKH